MSKLTGRTSELLHRIDDAFPIVPMPHVEKLVGHGDDCPGCSDLCRDLVQMQAEGIDSTAIRSLHQELHHLSLVGWKWVLPHYLRYCLTDDAIHNRFETEYLIDAFSPSADFEADTVARMTEITTEQASCLSDFFEWCLEDFEWRGTYGQDIASAQRFLAKHWNLHRLP